MRRRRRTINRAAAAPSHISVKHPHYRLHENGSPDVRGRLSRALAFVLGFFVSRGRSSLTRRHHLEPFAHCARDHVAGHCLRAFQRMTSGDGRVDDSPHRFGKLALALFNGFGHCLHEPANGFHAGYMLALPEIQFLGSAPNTGCFWAEADIRWQITSADLVENDPGCVKTPCCCYDSPVILGRIDEALR